MTRVTLLKALAGAAALCVSGAHAAESSTVETPSACVARLKTTPAACFVQKAKFALMTCRMEAETAQLRLRSRMALPGAGADQGSSTDADRSCSNGEMDAAVAEHYKATLKQFAKNKDATERTKDFYAHWKAAMSGLQDDSRAPRQTAELDALGERLKLEQ